MKELFSKNGIKQLESMKFNDKQYLNKVDNTVTITDVIPSSNKFYNSTYNISDVKLGTDYFTCNVNFYNTNTNENDVLVYYAITKSLKIVKSDDNYLIDNIIYSNN